MFFRSSRFRKQFKRCSEKTCSKVFKQLNLLLRNEFDGALNNHKLSGKYSTYRSIDVTGDIRIVYRRMSKGFYLVAIGTHSELYK